MLHRHSNPTNTLGGSGAPAKPSSLAVLVATLLGAVRRQFLPIVLIATSVFGLGAIYLVITPPGYTAFALLLLDSRRAIVRAEQSPVADAGYDPARVESQVQLLRTDTIALSVIKELNLTEDPEFACDRPDMFGALIAPLSHLFEASRPCTEFERTRFAAAVFANRLGVRRVGLSYMIEISFTSRNSQRAAEIANAVADAHILDQMDARYQVVKRSSIWLQDRLRELSDQASAAQRTVIEFKIKNDIVDSGGRLSNDQQLSELYSQLVAARVQISDSKAKLDRIGALLLSDPTDKSVDATVTDTLRSDVINQLRTQYLDIQRRLNEWSLRYGIDHLAVIQARNQSREIKGSILDELKRVAETYKSDYDIAKRRVEAIQSEVSRTIADSQITNQALVALRELESNAQTARSLHDNFLQRHLDAVQQQSFPITEARVVTKASPPLTKSKPRTFLVLAFSLGGGLITAVGFGLLRDSWYPVFRSSSEVEDILQTRCIAALPLLRNDEPTWGTASRDSIPDKTVHSLSNITPQDVTGVLTQPSGDCGVPVSKSSQRIIRNGDGPLWRAAKSPMSAFAEAIRSIKLSIDLNRPGNRSNVIGITSALPYEGKSTVSGALALLIAQTGARTVLVDCDLRNPTLTKMLAPNAQLGFLDVVSGTADISDVAWAHEGGALTFLPGVTDQKPANTMEILASSGTTMLIEMLREQYDYVLIDLSPLTPVVDVRATAQLVDTYLLVVEWGRTRVDQIEHALRDAQGLCDKLLGVALNKMPSHGRVMGYRGHSEGTYYGGPDRRQ
jgi:polysaccharide biosynthesis transport protein